MNRRAVIFSLVVVLAIAALIGTAFGAYNQGMAQSMTHAATAEYGSVPSGPIVAPYGPFGWGGYPHYYHWSGFGWGFALFGALKFLLFVAVTLFVIRLIVGGRRGPGPWAGPPGTSRFDEWHRRAHDGDSSPQTPAQSQVEDNHSPATKRDPVAGDHADPSGVTQWPTAPRVLQCSVTATERSV